MQHMHAWSASDRRPPVPVNWSPASSTSTSFVALALMSFTTAVILRISMLEFDITISMLEFNFTTVFLAVWSRIFNKQAMQMCAIPVEMQPHSSLTSLGRSAPGKSAIAGSVCDVSARAWTGARVGRLHASVHCRAMGIFDNAHLLDTLTAWHDTTCSLHFRRVPDQAKCWVHVHTVVEVDDRQLVVGLQNRRHLAHEVSQRRSFAVL